MSGKFIPRSEKREASRYLMLRVTPEMSQALYLAKKRSGVSKARLVEQMVIHCLADMGINVNGGEKSA